MDCCNYGEYGAWDATYAPYAPYAPPPSPYAPYSQPYYPSHAHDPYARYYRYSYPAHHAPHVHHVMPMGCSDYGSYATKEARVRRGGGRREARALTPPHHLPPPATPPLECGMNGRVAPYCEPTMWSHYQMGMRGGWSPSAPGSMVGSWSRTTCAREYMRYPTDYRPLKSSHLIPHQVCPQDGRITPYPRFGDSPFNSEHGSRPSPQTDFPIASAPEAAVNRQPDCPSVESRHSPPEEKRPPVVPLPAFQQAFGSLEIGKFAEAFSRTEVPLEESSSENFGFELFNEWDGSDPQWTSQSREIKCEDNSY